jgi:hypothetical protein
VPNAHHVSNRSGETWRLVDADGQVLKSGRV